MDDIRTGGNGSAQEAIDQASSYAVKQATDAIERLRGVVEQATTTFRDLSQASAEWAQDAQGRARDMAKNVRDQSERAMGATARQVEEYPLTSIVLAAGVGFMLGMMIQRLR
jgi:ElaB/YqjD/DUF883 family membrane-anchored ribosome-binding protein